MMNDENGEVAKKRGSFNDNGFEDDEECKEGMVECYHGNYDESDEEMENMQYDDFCNEPVEDDCMAKEMCYPSADIDCGEDYK
jgi:hypothetical protein